MTHILADHFGLALARRADADRRIWALDGDLADSDGALHFARRHPGRFVTAGIAEQNMISMAGGMATTGLRPFVFSFAAFLCYRGYDQIRMCVSQSRQPVTLVGSHAGGVTGRNGKSHSALHDLALMLSLPGMRVWSPADVPEVHFALAEILSQGAPAYVRLPRRPIGRTEDLPGVPAAHRWLTPPAEVAIVSTGLATHWALDAAMRLLDRGHAIGVVHCLRVDAMETLAETLADVRLAVVVEDHSVLAGFASAVRHAIPEIRVSALGWPSDWSGKSGGDADMIASGGFSVDKLSATIAGLLGH